MEVGQNFPAPFESIYLSIYLFIYLLRHVSLGYESRHSYVSSLLCAATRYLVCSLKAKENKALLSDSVMSIAG